MAHFEEGRAAARVLWKEGLAERADFTDPLTTEFASGALTELEHLQQSTPRVLQQVLEGAEISAEQLNVESFHGVLEVIQNADDLGASRVKVAVRGGRRSTLTFAHDGERVRLPHVIAMSLAFLSTKRGDSRAKGRFGIGLKTLGRLSSQMTVHCHPYHFVIQGSHVRPATPKGDSSGSETLIELDLTAGLDIDSFARWFEDLGPEAMLFLDSVRDLEFIHRPAGKPIKHSLQVEASGVESLPLGIEARVTVRKDLFSQKAWTVFTQDCVVPTGLHRRHKAIGQTSPVGIAVPVKGALGDGQLYAGLPLQIKTGLTFAINGQFDVDVARRYLQHESLNKWIINQAATIAASVALQRFSSSPREAWRVVPLSTDLREVSDSWLEERLDSFVSTVHSRVRRNLRVNVRSQYLRAGQLAYESTSLDGLLEQSDIDYLASGKTLLPTQTRDRLHRWREVLRELDVGNEVSVVRALSLLSRDDDAFDRPVDWFICLVSAALDENSASNLWNLPCVVTSDGTRIVPPTAEDEGQILCCEIGDSRLAFELDLAHVIHEEYLTESAHAAQVRGWLEECEILQQSPDAEASLTAIVTKASREGVLDLSDGQIRAVRDELSALEKPAQSSIGRKLGRSIAFDGFRWEGGKKLPDRAAPAQAYLPATIEGRRDGISWAKVSNKTSGLFWIHTRYEQVLKTDRLKRGSEDETRLLGALNFLRLLGAEVTPRLERPPDIHTRHDDPASPIDRKNLPAIQREFLNSFDRWATHLKNDYLSPDLQSVIDDIARERSRRVREVRARGLIGVLDREWDRIYSSRVLATAVYSQNTWRSAGRVPATWVARAADTPWLTSEAGKRRKPSELAVRTPATEAIFGNDRSIFSAEVDASLASSAVVRVLRIRTDPEVSEVVEHLSQLRSQGSQADASAVLVRYAAIAAAVPGTDLAPEDSVGDLTVRQLRGRFGSSKASGGLIFVTEEWLAPSNVLLGRPIFGGRRAFAPGPRSLDPLWRLLKISPPTLHDCVEVLGELTFESAEANENIIVNTYLYLDELLKDAKPKEKQLFRKLPLWTTEGWCTERPIFAVEDAELARSLAGQVSVWVAPLQLKAIPNFVEATGVILLSSAEFTASCSPESFVIGEAYRDQWVAAVELLRDWLTRHDPQLAASIDLWTQLATSRIALDPDFRLTLKRPRRRPITAKASAHFSRDPWTICVVGDELLGEDEVVGRLVAEAFSRGDRDKIALAWSRAWTKAEAGERARVAVLEELPSGEDVAALFEQARSSSLPTRQFSKKETQGSANGSVGARPDSPPRRLKNLEEFVSKDVRMLSGVAEQGFSATGRSKGSGLVRDPSGGRVIGASKPASASAPRAYSDQEKEDLGLEVLQLAINGDSQQMRDFRHLRGVGADALDRIRRFFELKAHFGAMPDHVSLTDAEHERAVQERGSFVLAVVAGLEEGYETIVKVIPDPLQHLRMKPATSVTLTGIRSASTGVEVRLVAAQRLDA